MTYILYGYTPSTCYQRVRIIASELDLKLECVNIDMATGAQKREPHLSRNPFGQVPAFEDSDTGVRIFEQVLTPLDSFVLH
jgi:glutathione S-transferase